MCNIVASAVAGHNDRRSDVFIIVPKPKLMKDDDLTNIKEEDPSKTTESTDDDDDSIFGALFKLDSHGCLPLDADSNENPSWLYESALSNSDIDALYQLALDVATAFEAAAIPLWIDGGTLLGAVRHHGLIPWDDDIDFSTLRTHRHTIETQIFPALHLAHYGTLAWWYDGYRIFPLNGRKIDSTDCRFPFVDLFFMRVDAGNLFYSNARAASLWRSALTQADIAPVQKLEFGPIELPAPRNFLAHLDSLYGGDWRDVVYRDRDHRTGEFFARVKHKPERFVAALPTRVPERRVAAMVDED